MRENMYAYVFPHYLVLLKRVGGEKYLSPEQVFPHYLVLLKPLWLWCWCCQTTRLSTLFSPSETGAIAYVYTTDGELTFHTI